MAVLTDAVPELGRLSQGGHVCDRVAVAKVPQDEFDGSSEWHFQQTVPAEGVAAPALKSRSSTIGPVTMANGAPPGSRLDAVEVVGGIDEGLDGGNHSGKMRWPAAGHHCLDGDLLDGCNTISGRDSSDHLVAIRSPGIRSFR